MPHPLLEVLLAAADGRPPTPDGSVELLPPPAGPVHAVLTFTAHSYVAAPVEPDRRGHGLGRALATAARHLNPRDEPLFAQVTPGNVASVRALLAAGYAPVASEVLLSGSHEPAR